MKRILLLILMFCGFLGFSQTDMSVTNTNYQEAFIPGYPSVYTVSVTNNGPGDASNVLVTNPIPAGITQFSWVGDNGSSGTNVPLNDLIGIFNLGETVTYTITLFVPAGYVGTLTSSATVTSTTADPTPANNQMTDIDIAPSGADMVLVKSDNSATYTAGNSVTYSILVSNHGPQIATNVAIGDILPPGIVAANVTWSGDNGTSGTGALNDVIANFPVGDTIIYQVVVPVPSDFDQNSQLINVVTVSSDTPDPNPTCIGCTDLDEPNPLADIVAFKTNNQTQYLVDEDTTYTITMTNNGPSDAVNVVVTDPLPTNITEMEWSGDNGSSGTGALLDNIASLPVGATVVYTVTIHIPQNHNTFVGNLVNIVNITSDTPDPVPACPTCVDVDTPRPKWVTVNTNVYTVEELVEDILIDSDCANVSNFSSSINSNIGVGYFHKNNSNFPLESGVVIRCGDANECEGPFDDNPTSTVASNTGDAQLQAISIANGNGGNILDTSFIKFDFLPLTDNFSFNFLFASNEYGTFQCTFGDVFAFILTDLVTGTTQNLAVIPSTTTPVSVTSIRDISANGGCASVNPEYFGSYNVANPANAAIDMRGQTIPMMASATVIPNNPYSIKLVIGDYQDTAFDSAVFIEAGSFNVGQANIGSDFLADAGSAICDGETVLLDTELNPAQYTFVWVREDANGIVVLPDTTPTYLVTQPGTYTVTAANGTCEMTDSIVIEYLPELPILQPDDINLCDDPAIPPIFNLTDIESSIFGPLNPLNYDVTYYHSQADAINAFAPIAFPFGDPTAYPGINGEVIWIRVDDTATSGCYVTRSFTLNLINCDPVTPPNLVLCDDSSNDGQEIFDFTPQTAIALGNNSPADYIVTYHLTSGDANADLNPIPTTGVNNISAFQNSSNPQTIFIRVESATDATLFSTTSFQLIVNSQPATPNTADVFQCDTYTLPALPVGSSYHSASGGASPMTNLTIVDSTTPTVVWIFSESGTNPNCTAEASFIVTIYQTPATPVQANITTCDTFTLPALPAGSTYNSASGGNTPLGATPTITTQGVNTIWIYAQTGTTPNCTAESSFTVTINQTPVIPVQANIPACDTFTLADLPAGSSYHNFSGGTTPLISQTINTPGVNTIWIYAENVNDPTCFSELSFTVTINTTPVISDPADVVACNEYVLPALNGGNYFSAPNGGGTGYFAGDVITASMTMYVFAQTGTTPNCFSENSFEIGIFFSPVINTAVTSLEVCDDNNDGFRCGIDLTSKTAEITGGAANLVATFHETLTDAQNGVTAIPNPAAYCNIEPGIQIIYVRVTDALAPQCASITTFEIHVNPVPVANPSISDYALCDVTTPGDGVEVFDLTTKNPEILGVQTGVNVTYYLSQADALVPTNPIVGPTAYTNLTPTPQEIWVRLENAATGCFGVGSFNLVVNPLPLVVPPSAMNACSDGLTGTASFNLSSNDLTISGGVTGVIVSYYATLADAQGEIAALPNPYSSGTATIYVRVENATTGCFDTTSLDLVVTQGPPASVPAMLNVCDPNNDCFAPFDLTDSYGDIVGLPVPIGVVITFHETLIDAQNGVTAIPNPTDYTNIVACDQVLYVRVAYSATGCYNIVELAIHVNLTPQGTEIPALEVCDDNTDGVGTFNLDAAVAAILGNLDPTAHTVSFYTLEANAQSGTNPITNVLGFASASAIIWVRIEDNATGCFDIIELELIVNPLPIPPLSGAAEPYSLCDVNNPGDEKEEFDLCSRVPQIVNGQLGMEVTFHVTQADAFSGINDLPCLYINDTNAQTLHVRIENIDTGCFVLTTMDIRVEPLPSPIPPAGPIVECDQDGDGFAIFDLDALIVAMLQGEPNTTLTFHETLENAENGVDAISPSNAYNNIDPYVQYIYVLAVNNITGCQSVMMIELNVTASPVVPVLEDQTKCDQDAINQDGFTNWDLTTQEAVILAAQVLPLDPGGYTITYYTSEAAANAGTAPIFPATNYINGQNPQEIWVRVEGVDSECFNIGSFELNVNTPLALTTPTPLTLCDDGPSGAVPHAIFDLTVKDAEITGGVVGYTVDYYVTQADQLAGTNPIADYTAYENATNAQTLFVSVTGPAPSLCRSFTTLTIRVLPLPVPLTADIPLLEVCDDNLPTGTELFDLTQNEDYIRNNDPSLIFEYYPTQADAEAQTNQILPATAYEGASGTIWIRVMKNTGTDYLGEFCYVLVQQEILVNPLPVVPAAPVEYTICDVGATGVATFELDSMNDEILAADPLQVAADFTIKYFLTQADALAGTNQLPNLYDNITNPQDIYVSVVNNATGCVNATAIVTLEVAEGALSAAPADYASCDTDTDGQMSFDLPTLFDTEVLAGQDATLFTVAYYTDALGQNLIATPGTFVTGTTTLYAIVTNVATACESDIVAISITVEPLADPVITTDNNYNTICVDIDGTLASGLTLHSGLDPANYSFEWYLGGVLQSQTGADYIITDPAGYGDYTVVATSLSVLGCVSAPSAVFEVILSGQAAIVGQGYTVTNAFSDNQTITVTVDGNGAGFYQYQLDDGPILNNGGIFTNVSPGEHTVTIYDVKGNNACDPLVIGGIWAIDYPHFFTPNGDGINDTWNIIGLGSQQSAKIYIFDRYGKLLKQLSPLDGSEGWNGIYNGQLLPSTDYWFSVTYPEAGVMKEFKAHFSLKR